LYKQAWLRLSLLAVPLTVVIDLERGRTSKRGQIGADDFRRGQNPELEEHLGLLRFIAGEGGSTMASGKSDELKGRVKEAAGALIGDKELKKEGQADQAVGKVKQKVEKMIDKVKEAAG
jgi:uncharacterized protein YjbJ (UPF0337 family)